MRMTMAVLPVALSFCFCQNPAKRPVGMTMDTPEITRLIEFVVGDELTLRQTQAQFGKIKSRSPTQVLLDPNDRRFERVVAETLPPGSEVVVSIAIRLVEPVPVDLAFFKKLYGNPRTYPRLKPNQPTPLGFDVHFGDRKGRLLLQTLESRLQEIKVDRFDSQTSGRL